MMSRDACHMLAFHRLLESSGAHLILHMGSYERDWNEEGHETMASGVNLWVLSLLGGPLDDTKWHRLGRDENGFWERTTPSGTHQIS